MAFRDCFSSFPVLETNRLILRPFTLTDIDDYIRFFSDPDVQQYLGNLPIPKDRKSSEQWVNNMNGRCFKSKLVITWAIECKASERLIGRIDLGGFVMKSMADLAYYLAKEHWSNGYMSEAVERVVQFGFDKLMLHRIQATVMPENMASLHILKKNGFQEEGLLRKYPHGREFHDVILLAALREEK